MYKDGSFRTAVARLSNVTGRPHDSGMVKGEGPGGTICQLASCHRSSEPGVFFDVGVLSNRCGNRSSSLRTASYGSCLNVDNACDDQIKKRDNEPAMKSKLTHRNYKPWTMDANMIHFLTKLC